MGLDFSVIWDNMPKLLEGFGLTLLMTAITVPIAVVLGTGVAMMRVSGYRLLSGLAICYVEFIRNTPFLIQIYLMFFALPFFGVRIDAMVAGIATLALYGGAYMGEIFRGGILSVHKGQIEAGRALGLGFFTIMGRIGLPQIDGYVIPPTSNIIITMLKETSVLSVITVAELTYMAHDINGRTFSPLESFVTIAVFYWIASSVALVLMGMIDKRSTAYTRVEGAR